VNRLSGLLTVLLLCGLATSLQAAPVTEIVPLRHASADSMVSALQPFLDADEGISAYGNQLILRAEPGRLPALRQLVQDLDRRPARLRISVANAGSSFATESGFEASGRIRTGPGEIIVGEGGSTQTRIIRRETRGASDGVRQITASEGHPVLIQTGQSIPLRSTTINAWGHPVEQTTYRDALSGFYATVRLSGDIATITINTRDDRVNAGNNNVIDLQRTESVVSAPLGQWVTIGQIDDLDSIRGADLNRRMTTRRQGQQTIRLMVERLD
jgi:hypothetical protein